MNIRLATTSQKRHRKNLNPSLTMICRPLTYIYVLTLSLTATLSHAGRVESEKVFAQDYQTPPFDISRYKSPEQRGKTQRENVSVAVCISGGGHRAANFGIGAMMGLENVQIENNSYNSLQEIDYFSTVSGGGFAAAVYISSLDRHQKAAVPTIYSLRSIITNNIAKVNRPCAFIRI